MHHGDSQCQPLPPAYRQVTGNNFQLAAKPDKVSCAGYLLPVSDSVHPAVKLQVFPNGEIIIDGKLLGHVSHAGAYLFGFPGNIIAEYACLPGGWRQQTQKHAECGGLAGTIGAKVPDNLAAMDIKRYGIDSDKFTKAAGEMIYSDNIFRLVHCQSPINK